MNKEIIDSLLERAEEMLKGDNSREISTEEIITILKEYKQLQQELKDGINARFEMQRRIDKQEKIIDSLAQWVSNLSPMVDKQAVKDIIYKENKDEHRRKRGKIFNKCFRR